MNIYTQFLQFRRTSLFEFRPLERSHVLSIFFIKEFFWVIFYNLIIRIILHEGCWTFCLNKKNLLFYFKIYLKKDNVFIADAIA